MSRVELALHQPRTPVGEACSAHVAAQAPRPVACSRRTRYNCRHETQPLGCTCHSLGEPSLPRGLPATTYLFRRAEGFSLTADQPRPTPFCRRFCWAAGQMGLCRSLARGLFTLPARYTGASTSAGNCAPTRTCRHHASNRACCNSAVANDAAYATSAIASAGFWNNSP